jgi:alpha-N-arabinofuranosidase
MNLISEHFYVWDRSDDIPAHVATIVNNIRSKAEAHRRLQKIASPSQRDSAGTSDRDAPKKLIPIAMDEWNYWFRNYEYGELGCPYELRDALGIAAGLHEYYRNTDIIHMAHYAQTVNVIGCIKTTPTAAAFETTGLVLKLYRQEFGTIPLAVEGAPEPLDVSAAFTEDRKALTLAIVNPTGEVVDLPVSWQGIRPSGPAKGWEIAHDDPMAYNTPGEAPKVEIRSLSQAQVGGTVKVKPYSVTLLRIPV